MQDSLPAAGPALPGGIGYPQGSCERFHGCNDSPFPSFLARCQFIIRTESGPDLETPEARPQEGASEMSMLSPEDLVASMPISSC